MKTLIQYTVADDTTIYAETSTRDQARNHLRTVKAQGKKTAKIFKEEYCRLSSTQVR